MFPRARNYAHCSGLVGYRNGFETDLNI